MKKLLICASVLGITVGVACWLYKKEKANKEVTASPVTNKANFDLKPQEEKKRQDVNVTGEMNQAKSDCAQDVYERHTAAGEVMKDAYRNIMEDFVEDYSDEDATSVKEKDNKIIIDSEDVTVIKELDSISNELDDLLK